jgi:predicted phage tail protein
MRSPVLRLVVGVVLVLVGAVWFLQGIDVLGGSSMTGNAFWAFVGAPMVVIGVLLLRRPRPARSDEPAE